MLFKRRKNHFFIYSWLQPVRQTMLGSGFGLVLVALTLLVSGVRAETLPAWQDEPKGKQIFDQKCAGCHSIGGGKLVGPDLKGVTELREEDWLEEFISDPQEMFQSDLTAQQLLKDYNNLAMPNLGLSDDEVEDVIEYLKDPGSAPSTTTQAAVLGTGDALAGRSKFLGEMPLAAGGAPCVACHNVNGAGQLGGGGLGPDLTHVVTRLGEPGLAAALNTIAFPTMLGPYQNRPLSPQEQADLVAFLKQSAQTQAPVVNVAPGALNTRSLLIFSIGLVGAVVLFVGMYFYWTRQKQSAADRLPVRKI